MSDPVESILRSLTARTGIGFQDERVLRELLTEHLGGLERELNAERAKLSEIMAALDAAGCPTGNEHKVYDAVERIAGLHKTRDYAWRQLDTERAAREQAEKRIAFLEEALLANRTRAEQAEARLAAGAASVGAMAAGAGVAAGPPILGDRRCNNALQAYCLSTYPSERGLVPCHKSNSDEMWYRRSDVDALTAELERLRAECSKWEEGCRVNCDALKDALRHSDNQRLEIITLRAKLETAKTLLQSLLSMVDSGFTANTTETPVSDARAFLAQLNEFRDRPEAVPVAPAAHGNEREIPVQINAEEKK